MADRAALEAALAGVDDPLLHRPLGSLGMGRSVDGTWRGAVRAVVALPVPNYPYQAELEERVRAALVAVSGGKSVSVEWDLMDDAQRHAVMSEIRAGNHPIGSSGSPTRVVAVASGKGGVGKSSVTTNLAVALSLAGSTVGIMDADVWGFSIPRMLGIERPPVVVDESILPYEAHGVKVMSMDFFVPEDRAVIWRGPMVHKAIEQFLQDVHWDDPDFLLVDMPPGTGDISLSLSQFLPRAQVLLVTTPQPTAQRVAKRAALMAAEVNQEVMGVVENMSWFTGDDGTRYELFGSGGGEQLGSDLGVPLMARIPLRPAMREGADRGQPVVLAEPGGEAARAFERLASAVVERKPRVRTHPELVIR